MTVRSLYISKPRTTSTYDITRWYYICDVDAGEFIIYANARVSCFSSDGSSYLGDFQGITNQSFWIDGGGLRCSMAITGTPGNHQPCFYVVLGKN